MYLLFAGYFMDYCSLLDDEICCLRNCDVTSLVCMLNVWRLLHKFYDVCCKTACCWDCLKQCEVSLSTVGMTYFCQKQWTVIQKQWIVILDYSLFLHHCNDNMFPVFLSHWISFICDYFIMIFNAYVGFHCLMELWYQIWTIS